MSSGSACRHRGIDKIHKLKQSRRRRRRQVGAPCLQPQRSLTNRINKTVKVVDENALCTLTLNTILFYCQCIPTRSYGFSLLGWNKMIVGRWCSYAYEYKLMYSEQNSLSASPFAVLSKFCSWSVHFLAPAPVIFS